MAEVDEVLGDKDEVEFDDLGQLKYMGQVHVHMLLIHHLCIYFKTANSLQVIVDCKILFLDPCTFHGLIFQYSEIQKMNVVR